MKKFFLSIIISLLIFSPSQGVFAQDDTINTQIAQLTTKLDAANEALNKANEALNKAKQESSYFYQLEELNSALNKATQDNNTNEINKLTEDINNLNDEIKSLDLNTKEDYSTEQAAYNKAQNKILELEAEIAQLKAQISDDASSQEAADQAQIDYLEATEPESAELKELQKEYYNNSSLKEYTFNVTENLILDDSEAQNKAYFEDSSNPVIVNLILAIINFALKIISTIAVIAIIIAGFIFILGQGEEQSNTKAKDIIKYTIIGLAITFSAYIIILFIQAIFTN